MLFALFWPACALTMSAVAAARAPAAVLATVLRCCGRWLHRDDA